MNTVEVIADVAADLMARIDALRARLPGERAELPAIRAAAEDAAAAVQALPSVPDELGYAAIRLLRKAGSFQRGLELVQQLRPQPASDSHGPLFHEMELSFLTGRTEDALRLLEQLEQAGKQRPSRRRAIERIREKISEMQAAAGAPADASEEARAPLLAERLQQVAALFPVREAGRYSARTAAAEVLADYQRESDPPHEATYAAIRLLICLKRYPEALALVEQRRPQLAAKARDVDLHEIYLCYRTGQHGRAEALLREFRQAGHAPGPRWKRTLAKLQRKVEAGGARDDFEEVEQALCQLRIDVDLQAHLPLVQALLPDPNLALETLLFVDRRLRALKQARAAARADFGVFRKYHRARLILSCGFSWSGSGAVSCFLEQHRSVELPFGRTEMAYLQGRDGRKGIYAFLEAGVTERDAMRARLARFLMESIVSLRRQHYSVLKPCLLGDVGCAAVLGQLFDDFAAAMLADDALQDVEIRRQLTGRFIQRLFSVRGGTHVLLNNVFLAPRTGLIGAMDDAIFVVVQRDARDQYLARKIESSHAGKDGAQVFAAMLRQNRSQFQAHVATVAPERLQEQLMLIRFEDFVSDEALRLEVLRRAGLGQEGLIPNPSLFDASVSARNVGIHVGALAADELAFIQDELGIYLS